MIDYKSLILNDLLTKYEHSAHFYGKAKINRRIFFKLDRKTVPAYFAGDRPQEKEALHQTVRELNKQGILTVEWIQGEKNNLLKQVSLNLDNIDSAYAIIGRIPRLVELAEVNRLIEAAALEVKTLWIKDFFCDCRNEITKQVSWPLLLPKDMVELELVLKALKGLDAKGEEDLLERIFSIRYLSGSKSFSRKVKASLIAIAASYYLKDDELADEDILHELGIIKTTEELLLSGPLVIELRGERMDLSPFTCGAVLDTQMAHTLEIVDCRANRVLLVENKTNFHYLARKGLPADMLLIYLGGFPGPKKRLFLAKLHAFCACKHQVTFLHWGDIDWGGLRIYMFLRENVLPSLRPVYMDKETLLTYKTMGESLSPSYRSKLIKLMQNNKYSTFFELITLMLELNIKLEQEALLAGDSFSDFFYEK
ncbi:MAG: DUF2220 family protein [Bacillota bacterium]|nr:DUF2220 family protein [Bacillota bacterium]